MQDIDSLVAIISHGLAFQETGADLDPALREWEDRAVAAIKKFFGEDSEIARRIEANALAARNPAGTLSTYHRHLARFNLRQWALRCLMFMKAQVNFFAGHHNRGERDAALANLGDLPAGAAPGAREVTRDHPPAVEFEGGVLRLSGLWWFEELDVLLMDYGSPEVYPLVTRGRIDGGEFQCSPIASLRLRAAPDRRSWCAWFRRPRKSSIYAHHDGPGRRRPARLHHLAGVGLGRGRQ